MEDLKKKVKDVSLPEGFVTVQEESSVSFLLLSWTDRAPLLQCAIRVQEDLSIKMALNGVPFPMQKARHLLDGKLQISSATSLGNLLALLKSKVRDDEESVQATVQYCAERIEDLRPTSQVQQQKLSFLQEQLLLAVIPEKGRKYSSGLLAAAAIWKTTSPALYQKLVKEQLFTLPSTKHLHKLMRPLKVDFGANSSLAYLRTRAEKLEEREKMCLLLIDEIYNAQRVEYAGGKFFGSQEGGALSKTLLSFMVKSLAGPYSDVVSFRQITTLDSSTIKEEYDQVMEALNSVGFKIKCVSMDNATPNRKFFVDALCNGDLKPSIPHPQLPDESLFLMFDSVHNFKNIYNNFLNRRVFRLPPFPNAEMWTASQDQEQFSAQVAHVEELYYKELGKPVKLAYKLSEKVLHPTAIEKTNVQLADSFFHDSTISALKFYATAEDKKDWMDTANFMRLVRNWWNIVNVKTPYHGVQKKNAFMEPISKENDMNLVYLKDFIHWLELWSLQTKGKTKQGLSSETFLAMKQTTKALIEMAKCLLEEHEFSYVLLGQIQSDPLEKRFGWYRHLAGSNYFISVRQILEAEKSIRLQSLIKFSGYSFSDLKETFEEGAKEEDEAIRKASDSIVALCSSDFMVNCARLEDKNIVFYVAGFVAHSLCKKIKCESCKRMLGEKKDMPAVSILARDGQSEEESGAAAKFLEQVNRGGLLYPCDILFIACLHIWSFYHTARNDDSLNDLIFQSRNPCFVFSRSFTVLCQESEDLSGMLQSECQEGHFFEGFLPSITKKMFNMFAKNRCNEINSMQHLRSKRSHRKEGEGSRKIRKLQSDV